MKLHIVLPGVLCLLMLVACDEDPPIVRTCSLNMESFDFSYGISYENPAAYLNSGDQSNLSIQNIILAQNEIGPIDQNIEGVFKIRAWINANFNIEYNTMSMYDSYYDVNYYYQTRVIPSNQAYTLIFSATLRAFGIPSVIVETASIQWAEDFVEFDLDHYSGIVLTEIYINDQWTLINNDGAYITGYDPTNPYINGEHSTAETKDEYFAVAKCRDFWEINIHSPYHLHERMHGFAYEMVCFEDWFGSKNYQWQY